MGELLSALKMDPEILTPHFPWESNTHVPLPWCLFPPCLLAWSQGDAQGRGCLALEMRGADVPACAHSRGCHCRYSSTPATPATPTVTRLLGVFSWWVAELWRPGDTGWRFPGLVCGLGWVPSLGCCPGSCTAPGLPGWVLTSSLTAQAAAAWIALRKGLPAQGSTFVTLAVMLVEKQAEETSGFSVPFPEAAGQWCPHVLPA